jgi:HK97 family phage portal protein
MKILGIQVRSPFVKAAPVTSYVPTSDWGGWLGWFQEWFAGAWQNNAPPVCRENVIAFWAVYACVNRIASDIAKMPINLMRETDSGVHDFVTTSPLKAVLLKPNSYQTRVQFIQQWLISKLLAGNTYCLKLRDARGVVTGLYVLCPKYVRPLVTPDGSVYYQLGIDPLSEVYDDMTIVPASEIIHDMMPALFHPLCGTSPIYACGASAAQGVAIIRNSTNFFTNMSRPSGVLTAPGAISKPTAERVKAAFEANYGGNNFGRIAVLGDGLKWEPMMMSASDAQMIEQLKWSAETVCSCFDVPPYKIGLGTPSGGTVEALNQQYLTQCLQTHIASMELLLTEGLNLSASAMRAAFDVDALLRMDTATRFKTWGEGIKGGFVHPNWARKKEGMQPVEGGDTPYMQQQNFPLEALSKQVPAAALPKPEPAPPAEPPDPDEDDEEVDDENVEEAFNEFLQKEMAA